VVVTVPAVRDEVDGPEATEDGPAALAGYTFGPVPEATLETFSAGLASGTRRSAHAVSRDGRLIGVLALVRVTPTMRDQIEQAGPDAVLTALFEEAWDESPITTWHDTLRGQRVLHAENLGGRLRGYGWFRDDVVTTVVGERRPDLWAFVDSYLAENTQ